MEVVVGAVVDVIGEGIRAITGEVIVEVLGDRLLESYW